MESCTHCSYYFNGWRSHSPEFPDKDWDVVEKRNVLVGTHAEVEVMEGTAKCKYCGRLATFGCTYGDGYLFQEKQ